MNETWNLRNKYEATIDQALAEAAKYALGRCCMSITRWQHFSV